MSEDLHSCSKNVNHFVNWPVKPKKSNHIINKYIKHEGEVYCTLLCLIELGCSSCPFTDTVDPWYNTSRVSCAHLLFVVFLL